MSPEPPSLPSEENVKEAEKDKEDDPENWVKRTSKGGNMSLMTVQKRQVWYCEKARKAG